MKRIVFVFLACALLLAGCTSEQIQGSKLQVEKVDGYKPNLPSVPTIPKPTVDEVYEDGTYSVYGLRKNIAKGIDTKVTVTAYIVEMYEKPVCEKGKPCHTLMPHLFLADEKDEPLAKRRLRLVGYAQSFKEMKEAKAASKKKRPATESLDGLPAPPPIVWDWQPGAQYKITGQFTRRSGSGFMETDGLIVYEDHTCLDCPEEEAK